MEVPAKFVTKTVNQDPVLRKADKVLLEKCFFKGNATVLDVIETQWNLFKVQNWWSLKSHKVSKMIYLRMEPFLNPVFS